MLCLLVSNIVNAISGLVLAVVPNYISILVLRTIFGIGIKGSWTASYVLSNIISKFFFELPQDEQQRRDLIFHVCNIGKI